MVNEEVIEAIEKERATWEQNALKTTLKKMKEAREEFGTLSGLTVKRVYTPYDIRNTDYLERIGFPGQYPYTRGIHATMYRARIWTMRQVVGVGSPKLTNERHKYLIAQGQTGLSNDFDLPTLIGYDSDHPMASGEVGRVGVAIDSQKDIDAVFDGIPLDRTSTSMTINGPAPILLAMYIVTGLKQGVSEEVLRGTIQNDPLKEYVSQNTYLLPPGPSVRVVADIFEYCSKRMPLFNPISICGYQMRDQGATAPQELAFAFANAIEYIKAGVNKGLNVDYFAPRISWLFEIQNDFFEEIAKLRAGRRAWAKIMKELFKAKKPESWKFRVHVQTAGVSLTAQQPDVNLIRGTIQALAAVIGGVQSLAVSTRDEAISIPSEDSQRLSIRVQQVIAHESGVASTVDPIGGSYYVEELTNRIEEEVWTWLERIDARGGVINCIKDGWIEKLISEQASKYQKEISKRERIVVGLNAFTIEEKELPFNVFRPDPKFESEKIETLKRLKTERDNEQVKDRLNKVIESAEDPEKNIVSAIVDAVKVYATEGEIMQSLVDVFGEYKKPAVY